MRRDADAAADKQRPWDIEIEAVSQRAEHMDRLSRPEGAERPSPATDGLD